MSLFEDLNKNPLLIPVLMCILGALMVVSMGYLQNRALSYIIGALFFLLFIIKMKRR